MQNQIDNTNKNIHLVYNDLKGDIKDVRNEMNQNVHYIYSDMKNLNNKIDIQTSKINDELKKQDARIITNEITINNHERMLYNLFQSNEKQKDIINEHGFIINKHQEMIMNCISNVKEIYQDTYELKMNILEEDKKLKEYAKKNDVKVENLQKKCQEGINQINAITEVLNKHTEILAEHSAAIAQVQALTYKNSEKIDEICTQIFNHESRIQNIEKRLDKIELILNEHQKALNSLTGDIKEMKDIIQNIIQRIEKLERKVYTYQVEHKMEKIEEYLEKFDENKLYEFAEFIVGLRNQSEPFDLDIIIKGIKLINGPKGKIR
jgi:DNA repair exonuclease SbcCD ATPase subunit